MLVVLIALISAVGVAGLGLFARQIALGRPWRPSSETVLLGAVTNFFDTLGTVRSRRRWHGFGRVG